MDLGLPEIECLVHYISLRLITILQHLQAPPVESWSQELMLARRVLILITVHNLPLQLPDPLAALGPLLLDSNVDSEEAARAILRVGTVGPPKQEEDASESSIPWTDAWWLPGGEGLASDYGTRSLQAFAQLARECFDAGGTKLETLQSRNLPLLCLELMQMELAAAYQLTRQALCKVEAEISFNFKRVREMDWTWGSKALIEASTMPRLSASEQPTYVRH
ncbi:hypothetical protein PAXINDRAFT_15786 [Paxillus involutus ATCC 200175]|uniref:Uncharacterized protein n=1 Tax=Paxillus involutus ATCC 200175 TaxID=664439 RepID=A0A0C9SSK3_PAXIN|nr:hypothetical protein PAXINDRAFT_15786 [Paxillus involutus ATCC 200175]